MARLFVAVRPPEPVLAQIAALPRAPSPGVRWVPAAQWHITIRFIGEADADAVRGALRSWSRGADASGPPAQEPSHADRVRVVLGPRVSRLGRSVVCLPAAGLDELAARVVEATAPFGATPDPRPFSGHLTLARLRHRAACGVTGTLFDASFDVDHVELVQSTLGSSGAQHEVLETFPVP